MIGTTPSELLRTLVVSQTGIAIVLIMQIYVLFQRISVKRAKSSHSHKHIIYMSLSNILSSLFIAIVVGIAPEKDLIFLGIFGLVSSILQDIGLIYVLKKLKSEVYPFNR